MNISRFEKDKNKLRRIYKDGYNLVIENRDEINNFI